MNCLSEIIGIKKACTDTEPSSGLYVNDLPGMSLKIADSAANSEKINGITLIEDRINFASNYIVNDFRNFLQDKFILNSILENSKVGYYKDDNSIVAATNKLKGLRINVREEPFININISRIGLRFDTSITTNILIYNLYTGELLYTLPITTVANEITYIDVNKTIATKRQRISLFVCIDASVSDHYAAYANQSNIGCSTCGAKKYISTVSSGQIDPASSKTETNYVTSTSTGGLTVDYSIECDMLNYICSISRSLAWPLLYKTGHLIMQELKHSQQLNTIVMINKAKNEELSTYYEQEYTKAMNQLTSNLQIPKDICFQCAPKIKKINQIP
jgi:hypothetical protein